MDTSPQQQARTRMFARVLGPFLVIIDVTAVARASEMQVVLSDFEASPLWSWVAGAFVLAFGLVIVATHQYWKGAAAVIVSLTGWLITLRGLLLFAFPNAFATVANSMIGAQGWWMALCVTFALMGLYLTYAGWGPIPRRPEPQAVSVNPHLPRAA